MTVAAIYSEVPSLHDLMRGMKEMKDSCKPYDKAEEYYMGSRPEFFADFRYRRALERTGTTFRLNYAKTPVEAVVDRLEINGIIGGSQSDQDLLDGLWDENQMDMESMEIHRRACEFGDAYALVWPSDDIIEEDDESVAEEAAEEADEEEPSASGLEVYYNDPRVMRVIYDEENPRRKAFAIKKWTTHTENGERQRITLYYKDRIEKYVTKPNSKGDDGTDWMPYDDGSGIWPVPNPYGKVPVFHFRTERPYGVPEHIDAYGPQDVITKTVITHMNTMDYHGFPQRYALSGNDLDDGESDSEDFGEDGLGQDDDDTIEGKSALKAQPGHMWLLKGYTSVGQFPAAESTVFTGPLSIYTKAMAQVTRTPAHRFDDGGNPPSGEMLRVAEAPFVKKVRARQISFGHTWSELLTFALKIMKTEGTTFDVKPELLQVSDTTLLPQDDANAPKNGRIQVTWENPAAKGDQLAWEIALLKRQAGVPLRQVLLDAGYSKKQLDAWGVPESAYTPPVIPPGLPGAAPGAPGAPGQAAPGAKNAYQMPPPVHVDKELPSVRLNPLATPGKIG